MKKYWVYFLLIILLAFFLRVYRFDYRFYFFSDSARDALVAREALRTGTIPQIASFSSAGPFVFGPEYYWFLMAAYMINPQNLLMPYYFLIGLSLIFLILMMALGNQLAGRKFGLLIGFVVAVSPRQVFRSMSLTQHTVVAVCAAAALFFLIRFFRKKNHWSFFWCGFWVSMAISMHYQAMGLLIFGAAPLLIKSEIKNKIFLFFVFALGAILPMAPLFIWDFGQNFANVRNLLDYLLIGQYRIYVANRWLWHLFDFWPSTFADLLGGNKIIGGLIMYFGILSMVAAFLKQKINRSMKFIFIVFIFFFIYLRYYRGEKFEGYLIYLHPLIFVIISWALYQLIKFKKLFLIFVTIILIFNFSYIKNDLAQRNVNEFDELERLTKKIENITGHDKKLAVYNFADAKGRTETSDISGALSLYLDSQGKLDYVKGRRIGFCKVGCPDKSENEINDKFLDFYQDRLFLISNDNKMPLSEHSPHAVFDDVLFWWKKNPLKSSFNLRKYIYERTFCRNCHI
jgi:hypothetical protein